VDEALALALSVSCMLAGVGGVDDLAGIDALEVERGHAEAAVPELALADVEWHALT
jgi:hypothetical protein